MASTPETGGVGSGGVVGLVMSELLEDMLVVVVRMVYSRVTADNL